MKKSELQKIIREEIGKVINESTLNEGKKETEIIQALKDAFKERGSVILNSPFPTTLSFLKDISVNPKDVKIKRAVSPKPKSQEYWDVLYQNKNIGQLKFKIMFGNTLHLIESGQPLKETYYNPEWKLTTIKDWIETYAMNNRLNFKLIKKVERPSGTGSKTTFYVYDIGDKYGIVIKDDKVAGAPRLSEIDVIIGVKGSAPGALSKSYTISGVGGSEQELIKLLDKVITVKESVSITEDWKTTIAKAVIKKDKNKFNQYTFDVVDNGKVLATYTPERNFIEIHTPEALEFFKHTFKELGIRPIEDKAGGEGKVTSYTVKDAGNMKLLKSIMSMSKSMKESARSLKEEGKVIWNSAQMSKIFKLMKSKGYEPKVHEGNMFNIKTIEIGVPGAGMMKIARDGNIFADYNIGGDATTETELLNQIDLMAKELKQYN